MEITVSKLLYLIKRNRFSDYMTLSHCHKKSRRCNLDWLCLTRASLLLEMFFPPKMFFAEGQWILLPFIQICLTLKMEH